MGCDRLHVFQVSAPPCLTSSRCCWFAIAFTVSFPLIIVVVSLDTPPRSLCQDVGYDLVKASELWCAKPCCEVPARRGWIVLVIAARDIKVSISPSILVCNGIIEPW